MYIRKYSKIFLFFSLWIFPFLLVKSRKALYFNVSGIYMTEQKSSMKKFLNCIFNEQERVWRKKTWRLGKNRWDTGLLPLYWKREIPLLGNRSLGLRPLSRQCSRMNLQLPPGVWVNGHWDFLPWGTFLCAECGQDQQRALEQEGHVDRIFKVAVSWVQMTPPRLPWWLDSWCFVLMILQHWHDPVGGVAKTLSLTKFLSGCSQPSFWPGLHLGLYEL